MRAITSSPVEGTISAPPSKSAMIRTVGAALLAPGLSKILHPSFCADSLSALRIADTLGASLHMEEEYVDIEGNGFLAERTFRSNIINCGESGLCMRMFAPIVGLASRQCILEGTGSLMKRPMAMVEVLRKLGAQCETENGYQPVRIVGPMKGSVVDLDGSESSQLLTGLLMALPLCARDSVINVSHLKSKPYIEMTLDTLRSFGITIKYDKDLTVFEIQGNQRYVPQTCVIEGDWSGAAFLLVAGAIAGGVKVTGLMEDSFQADRAIIRALETAGAQVEMGAHQVEVRKGKLKAFQFDAQDCPDLVPPLVALASSCEGKSTIYGIERLKHKESNRAVTLVSEFARLDIRIALSPDRMEVFGGPIKGDLVDSHNDHRIAMACAVAALRGSRPVVIENSGAVAKSYPRFFEDLASIRVRQ